MKLAPKPTIYSRAQWGANEKLRDQAAPDYGTVKAGFIHHTVNANNYTAAQVPALLRGIYAYHTQSRGWRDIGYNFLVDRFGRIWEGRYGGVDQAVVGAHTLGYNEVVLRDVGDRQLRHRRTRRRPCSTPTPGCSPGSCRSTTSGPTPRRLYVKNRYLQAINGHRDVGQTACPGRYLYAKIPAIRAAAADAAERRPDRYGHPGTPTPTPTPTPAPVATFTSPTQTPRAGRQRSPATLDAPGAPLNLADGASPDLRAQGRPTAPSRCCRPAARPASRRRVSTAGRWTRINLLAAVGDVTGDGRGDVLGRAAPTAHAGSTAATATARSAATRHRRHHGLPPRDLGHRRRRLEPRRPQRRARCATTRRQPVPGARARRRHVRQRRRCSAARWRLHLRRRWPATSTGDGRADLVGAAPQRLPLRRARARPSGPSARPVRAGAGRLDVRPSSAARGDLTGDGVGDVVRALGRYRAGRDPRRRRHGRLRPEPSAGSPAPAASRAASARADDRHRRSPTWSAPTPRRHPADRAAPTTAAPTCGRCWPATCRSAAATPGAQRRRLEPRRPGRPDHPRGRRRPPGAAPGLGNGQFGAAGDDEPTAGSRSPTSPPSAT